jgi:GTP cyclohydrolase II
MQITNQEEFMPKPAKHPKILATSKLPTAFGEFRCQVYENAAGQEEVCLIKGDLDGQDNVLCRLHSECITGEAFSSLKCDCKQQLEAALELIGKSEQGILIYLRQEGRGIGLGNKIRAYAEQEKGLDTVDANTVLGLPEDARNYEEAAAILKGLGVKSVALMTNNPKKINALVSAGIPVNRVVQNIRLPSKEAQAYVTVKKTRMGHLGNE